MATNDSLNSLLNRQNSCIITYGHYSSQTCIGSDHHVSSFGLIPLTFSWIFKLVEEHRTNCGLEYQIKISILEIESDQVFDLIDNNLCGIEQISTSYKNVLDPGKALIYFDSALTNRKCHQSSLFVSILINTNDRTNEKSLSTF